MSFLVELTNRLLVSGVIREMPVEDSVPKYLLALKRLYEEACEKHEPSWVEACLKLSVDVYIATMSKDAFLKCFKEILTYDIPSSQIVKP